MEKDKTQAAVEGQRAFPSLLEARDFCNHLNSQDQVSLLTDGVENCALVTS